MGKYDLDIVEQEAIGSSFEKQRRAVNNFNFILKEIMKKRKIEPKDMKNWEISNDFKRLQKTSEKNDKT